MPSRLRRRVDKLEEASGQVERPRHVWLIREEGSVRQGDRVLTPEEVEALEADAGVIVRYWDIVWVDS